MLPIGIIIVSLFPSVRAVRSGTNTQMHHTMSRASIAVQVHVARQICYLASLRSKFEPQPGGDKGHEIISTAIPYR